MCKSCALTKSPNLRKCCAHIAHDAQITISLDKQGIIDDAKGPKPWVFPLVIVPEAKDPESVCICIDMRCPNTAIRKENLVTPTDGDFI